MQILEKKLKEFFVYNPRFGRKRVNIDCKYNFDAKESSFDFKRNGKIITKEVSFNMVHKPFGKTKEPEPEPEEEEEEEDDVLEFYFGIDSTMMIDG
jgi:hypothetical protein